MEEEGDQEEEEGGEEEEKEGSTEDEVDDDDDDGDGDDEGEKEPRPRKRAGGKRKAGGKRAGGKSKASKRSKKTSNPSHHSEFSLLVLPEGGATFVREHMLEKSWVNLKFNGNAVGQFRKLYDEASKLALLIDSRNHTPDHLWETIMRKHAKGMNNVLQPHQQLQPKQPKQCLRRMLNEDDYPKFREGSKKEFVRVMWEMNDLVRGGFEEVLSTLTEGLVDEKGAPYLHSIRSILDVGNFKGCVDQHNHLDFLAPATSTEVGLISATSFVAKVIFFVLFRGLVLALVHQSRCYFLVGLENYCSAKAATSCPTFSIPTERFSRLDAFMVGFQRELFVVLDCLSLHSLERLSIAAANTRLLFPLLDIRK